MRLAATAVVLLLLVFVLPFDELVAALRRVPPLTWPAALTLYLSLHLLGVTKWRLLVNAAGAGLAFRDAARAYYGGLFGNTFLPSLVGGDVVRAGMVFGVVRSKSGLVLGSLVDRVQDVVGLALVAGVGALLSPRALDPQSRRIFVTLGGLLVVGGLMTLVAWRLVPTRRIPYRYRRRLVQVRRALRATTARPHLLVAALGLGVALQSLLVVLNWWLGRTIGIEIPLYVWFFVWPLAKIAALVPVTQGGIGIREAAQAVLFAPFGVSAVMAVATGLVFQAVIIGGGLVGGAIAFLLGRGSLPTGTRPTPAPHPGAEPGLN